MGDSSSFIRTLASEIQHGLVLCLTKAGLHVR